MPYAITSERSLRAAFWRDHRSLVCRYVNGTRRPRRAPQNLQPCDTRSAWVEYVDACRRNGMISEALADRATL